MSHFQQHIRVFLPQNEHQKSQTGSQTLKSFPAGPNVRDIYEHFPKAVSENFEKDWYAALATVSSYAAGPGGGGGGGACRRSRGPPGARARRPIGKWSILKWGGTSYKMTVP